MEDLILNYNRQATTLIKSLHYQPAFKLLSKALTVLKTLPETAFKSKMLSLTYSNFSALYKDLGRTKDAATCLIKVIDIEKSLSGSKLNTINAYLSLCEIYSRAKDHESAVKNGLTALILLQKESPLPNNYISTLVIAYHNVGVEYEYMKKFDDAADCYKKGWDLARGRLGLNNPLTISIKNSFVATSAVQISKLPDLTYRSGLQNILKRSDGFENAVHTGSTSSSGAHEIFHVMTPRSVGWSKRDSFPSSRRISAKKNRIDLAIQRTNERHAAVRIQSWWKGIVQRRKFIGMKLRNDVKKAAIKAKLAYNEFKFLKEELSRNQVATAKKSTRTSTYPKKSALSPLNHIKDPSSKHQAIRKSLDISIESSFEKSLKKKDYSLDKAWNKTLPLDALTSRALHKDKHVNIKSTNNQIHNLKSRVKNRLPISLQQVNKKFLNELIKIQAFGRMIGIRTWYLRIKRAVLVIQKYYRRYGCRKLFKEVVKSIVRIQKEYKKYRLRNL
ncbi:hypothetical protein SteCoe_15045 [Stentor coeruleus]|uniref:Uncharacterized protein n=1 Tax=Stentor coeruleus TaxID=5963 RepID=A0A1R2C4J7_9CILI|nr:hypothetical protein SteCoe_15045 [Stentor coeruleus]